MYKTLDFGEILLEWLLEKQQSINYLDRKKSLGVEIFLAKKWVDRIINMSKVRDRIIVIRVLVQRVISVILVCAPQCSLDDCQKNNF